MSISADIDCGTILPIPYGTVKYVSNTTHVGSEVIFSCAPSHKLSGPLKRKCLETGIWSDASPKCEGRATSKERT